MAEQRKLQDDVAQSLDADLVSAMEQLKMEDPRSQELARLDHKVMISEMELSLSHLQVKGLVMMKSGRSGAPKEKTLWFSSDRKCMLWKSEKGAFHSARKKVGTERRGSRARNELFSSVQIQSVQQIELGQTAPNFTRLTSSKDQAKLAKKDLSFSIHYVDAEQNNRTLDLQASSVLDMKRWLAVLDYIKGGVVAPVVDYIKSVH